MPETIECSSEKVRIVAYLPQREFEMLNGIIALHNRNKKRGRSEAVTDALRFYYGYLSGSISPDYLCGIYAEKVDAIVNRSTERLSALLFKQAVEINLLSRILAGDLLLPPAEYEKLRGKAVNAVKRTGGRIELSETLQEESLRKPIE